MKETIKKETTCTEFCFPKLVDNSYKMIKTVYFNHKAIFRNDDWFARVILTSQNKRVHDLQYGLGFMIIGTPQQFLNTDSIDEAEVYKLNYPVELFNSYASIASVPSHLLTLRKKNVVTLCVNL